MKKQFQVFFLTLLLTGALAACAAAQELPAETDAEALTDTETEALYETDTELPAEVQALPLSQMDMMKDILQGVTLH